MIVVLVKEDTTSNIHQYITTSDWRDEEIEISMKRHEHFTRLSSLKDRGDRVSPKVTREEEGMKTYLWRDTPINIYLKQGHCQPASRGARSLRVIW